MKKSLKEKDATYQPIALKEYRIQRLRELLIEEIEFTKNQIRKKQAQTVNEKELDQDINEAAIGAHLEDMEDDKPIYNPKNVPLGWDGKFIY